MQIVKRTMSWFPKPSAWAEAQQRAARRKDLAATYLGQSQSLISSLGAVRDNHIAGIGELAAKLAAKRLNIKI